MNRISRQLINIARELRFEQLASIREVADSSGKYQNFTGDISFYRSVLAEVRNASFQLLVIFGYSNIIWENGTWIQGNWYSIDHNKWKNGTWKNGTWNGGIWENGIWYGGKWKGGKWQKGFDYKRRFHGKDDSPDKWDN